jgi:gamma-glutamyltranspeptidase
MCPTIVTRDGIGVFAAGGAGGTRIPNSVYEVLLNYIGLGAPMDLAMAAPRLDTTGTLKVGLEKKDAAENEAFFQSLGYATSRGAGAYVSAVSFDPKNSQSLGLASGGS